MIKGSFEPDAGRLKNSNGKINALQRFNCSGFLAATMSAAGHKYYESQNDRFYSPRTHDVYKDFKRDNSCFFKPKISKKESILPGDILNTSYGHTIRILTVGKDPLGIKGVSKKSDCKKISHKRFNFTFAHSTSNDKTPGKNGVLVEEAKNSTTNIVKKLAGSLQDLCKAKFKKGTFKGTVKDKKTGERKVGWGWAGLD